MCKGGPPSRTFVYRHTPNEPPVCSCVARISVVSCSSPAGPEKRGAWFGSTTNPSFSCARAVDAEEHRVSTSVRQASRSRHVMANTPQEPRTMTRPDDMVPLLHKPAAKADVVYALCLVWYDDSPLASYIPRRLYLERRRKGFNFCSITFQFWFNCGWRVRNALRAFRVFSSFPSGSCQRAVMAPGTTASPAAKNLCCPAVLCGTPWAVVDQKGLV